MLLFSMVIWLVSGTAPPTSNTIVRGALDASDSKHHRSVPRLKPFAPS
jgi:hypothetical protein